MVSVKDTGFAEFAAGLLAGVLDAVIGAQIDQARKLLELQQAVLLDDAAYAKVWISDAQVKAALAEARAAGNDAADEATVRLALASAQRGLLQRVLDRGLPRILVDHGRVSARLMFSVDDSSTAAAAATGPAALTSLGRGLRLRATPVHARSPEFLRLQTNITGEVEITFKTVTD
jgi:hypothetical protein